MSDAHHQAQVRVVSDGEGGVRRFYRVNGNRTLHDPRAWVTTTNTWRAPPDPTDTHSLAATRRIGPRRRRRFARLSDLIAFRRLSRLASRAREDAIDDDSLGYTYEELLELDDRNVRCGLSKDELAGLGCFEAAKEHMNQTCHICLEGVEYAAVMVELECSHMYHKDCIHTWLKQKRSCPTCRSEL